MATSPDNANTAKDANSVIFILVRHGRTALNREGRLRGLSPVPLDEIGVQQAGRVARRLAELCGQGGRLPRPLAIGSSPRPRAVQTAQPIADALGLPVRLFDDLADMNYGTWQGLTLEEAQARDPELFQRWRRFPEDTVMPDGESLGAMQRRVVAVLEGCLAESKAGQCWVLVAHDVVWRAVFCWTLDVPLDRRDQFWQDPAAYNILEIPLDRSEPPMLRAMNETSHLDGLLD